MKHAKKAFLASLLSVVLSVTMLIGTTYAWFTDSVTSAGNKIVAGTLDIDLFQHNGTEYVEVTNSSAPIFGSGETANPVNANTLWEPGKTQVAYLKLQNNGSLALKYTVKLVVKNVAKDLYEVMEYVIVPNAQPTDVVSWDSISAGAASIDETIAAGASLTLPTQAVNVPMAPGSAHYFALAIHMQEEAGNAYQAGEVDFDLQVLATQDTVESDSFDQFYDEQATYPLVSTGSATITDTTDLSDALAIQTSGKILSASVPGAAAASYYQSKATGSNNEVTINLNVSKTGESATASETTVELEIDMSAIINVDGLVSTEKIEALEDYVTVNYDLGTGLENVAVKHSENDMDALANADATPSNPYGGYYYNGTTGVLTIKSKSFSPFTVTYSVAETPVYAVYADVWDDDLEEWGEQYFVTLEEALAASMASEDAGDDYLELHALCDLELNDYVFSMIAMGESRVGELYLSGYTLSGNITLNGTTLNLYDGTVAADITVVSPTEDNETQNAALNLGTEWPDYNDSYSPVTVTGTITILGEEAKVFVNPDSVVGTIINANNYNVIYNEPWY